MPSPCNAYALTTGDTAYEAHREDLQVLCRPLYWTSYMSADWLVDTDFLGAEVVPMSSASSKTAYGAAFDLHPQGRKVVGLTSERNVEFTESLGWYDQVLSYAEVKALSTDRPTVYADFAGDADLLTALRSHLGSALVHEVAVGVTVVEDWVKVVVGNGSEDLQRVWLDLLAGHTAPRGGNVLQLRRPNRDSHTARHGKRYWDPLDTLVGHTLL